MFYFVKCFLLETRWRALPRSFLFHTLFPALRGNRLRDYGGKPPYPQKKKMVGVPQILKRKPLRKRFCRFRMYKEITKPHSPPPPL